MHLPNRFRQAFHTVLVTCFELDVSDRLLIRCSIPLTDPGLEHTVLTICYDRIYALTLSDNGRVALKLIVCDYA
jgi:hypothetical protein